MRIGRRFAGPGLAVPAHPKSTLTAPHPPSNDVRISRHSSLYHHPDLCSPSSTLPHPCYVYRIQEPADLAFEAPSMPPGWFCTEYVV